MSEPHLGKAESEMVEVLATLVERYDHGHLEQVAYSRGHPKSFVPTWVFGPDAVERASLLRRPENIFQAIGAVQSP